MKKKHQEEEDFWEVIITLCGGFVIGAIVGLINWMTGNHW